MKRTAFYRWRVPAETYLKLLHALLHVTPRKGVPPDDEALIQELRRRGYVTQVLGGRLSYLSR